MKFGFTLLLLFMVSLVQGQQDTIVLRDGRIKRVHILNVDTTSFNIRYQKGKKQVQLHERDYIQFKHNGTWYVRNYPLEPTQLKTSDFSNLHLRKSFFRHPSNHSLRTFSIGLSFGYPIPATTSQTLEKNFSFNYRATIAPEIQINPKWSLQFSGVLGLGNRDAEETVIFDFASAPYYYSFLSYSTSSDPNNLPFFYGENKYFNSVSPDDPHTKELLYQFGISPKYYPFGHTRCAMFLSPGIHYGIGNYNQVDYYTTFEYSGNSWSLVEERAQTHRSPLNYLRVEFLTGLHFNLNEYMSVNYSFGISSDMILISPQAEDQVYIRALGSDYSYVDSFVYSPSINFKGSHSFIIHRFYWVFRFGKSKE